MRLAVILPLPLRPLPSQASPATEVCPEGAPFSNSLKGPCWLLEVLLLLEPHLENNKKKLYFESLVWPTHAAFPTGIIQLTSHNEYF